MEQIKGNDISSRESQGSEPRTANVSDILDNPLVKEFGIPYLKQAMKKEFGIETHEKEITKKAFGRFMYALRDFIQGTWWVTIAWGFAVMMIFVLYLLLRKWLAI